MNRRQTEAQETQETGAAPGKSWLQVSGLDRRKNLVRGALLLAITLLLLALLFRQFDWDAILKLWQEIPLAVWVGATLLTLTSPIITGWRWNRVLLAMGHQVPAVARSVLITFGIWPIKSLSPSKAGDFGRVVGVRRQVPPAVATGSVLVERVLDVAVLAGFALVGGIYFGDVRIAGVAAAAVLAGIGLFVVAGLKLKVPGGEKIQRLVTELLKSVDTFRSHPGEFLLVLLLTAANWLACVLLIRLLFSGVGADVPLGFTAAAFPIAVFVGLLPITLGGMGTRDSALVVLFAGFASGPQALAVGLLYSAFTYWLLSILGIPFTKTALDL